MTAARLRQAYAEWVLVHTAVHGAMTRSEFDLVSDCVAFLATCVAADNLEGAHAQR